MPLNPRTLRSVLRYVPQSVMDRRANRNCADERILAMRYAGRRTPTVGPLLDWLSEEFPEVRRRFELRLFPTRIRDWSPYRLHLPWLQDPVQRWSRRVYAMAMTVATQAGANGVPVLNPVDRMTNASKTEGARRMAGAGVRTAKTIPILDREQLLSLDPPVIIREDWAHGGPYDLARTPDELQRVRLGRFERPVAVEFIDAQCDDGIYRKYRAAVAGDDVVPVHIHATEHWRTKGGANIKSDALRDEEEAFTTRPDPNAARLIEARKALELEFAAFDYAYDREGGLVIWEANMLPSLHVSFAYRAYRKPAVYRTFAAMTRLYLRRAGFAVPDRLEALRV